MVDPKTRETGLPTFKILVEIDEHSCHSLPIPRDFLAQRLRIKKIAVQHKFLSDAVMQHLGHLETGKRRP